MAHQHQHQHPSLHPPRSLQPTSIRERPDLSGTIYVETAITSTPKSMAPPSEIPSRPAGSSSNAIVQPNMSDVAGVLRRNQACLNCRRRKLKCDAVRPHCGTCVRSHKHMLRSSPNSTAPVACEYDDGTGTFASVSGGQAGVEDYSPGNDDGNEEDGEAAKKKKRKGTGESKRKTRKDEEEEETDKLRKKIEALEAQLANQNSAGPSMPPQNHPQAAQMWSNNPSAFSSAPVTAPSPTAFLEMLSSAASAQASTDGPSVPGLRAGAAENAMMSTNWAATPTDSMNVSSGLTPFLSFADNQDAQLASDVRADPSRQDTNGTTSNSMLSDSRSSSMDNGPHLVTPPSASASQGEYSKSFEFKAGVQAGSGDNLNWPPFINGQGLQTGRPQQDPWRGVETVSHPYGEPRDGMQGIQTDNAPVDASADFNDAMQQQLLLDLFWPGWPQHLPEPNIVNDLVEAFFDLVPNLPRLLHRSRLLARLALPPTHSNFPHPALIHSVCAAAASWCAPAVYERSNLARSWDANWPNEKNMTFALKQAAYGKEAVQEGLNTGNRLFDVVRAMIILSRVFIDDTRMLECWAYSGLVSRMILPLGLNVRSAELSLKSVMLPPPTDALEREERRVAVWMAFYHDTVASSASGWGTSMSIDELTVPLPVSAKDFDEGSEYMESNPQDIESSDFWTRHPVADPFVMTVKAAVLLNRVNRFVRKWKNRHLRDDDDYDGMQRPEFRELANAVACLQMSFPPTLRNPSKLNGAKKLDIDLISAHMIPHAAIMCLYEPFADITDPNDGPARRIIGAAQNIVSIIQQLATIAQDGVSNLSNVMHSSASVCLVTAARTSLLFYRLALNQNDLVSAETHRMDIEMIRTSLQAFGQRFKIGHHHAQLIEYFLDRASRPDYAKLQAHYPTHPRPGAPELHPGADFGQCILNALNIKRGYWRKWGDIAGNVGQSPFGSTPDTAAYASSAAAGGGSTGGHSTATGSATQGSARISRISSDSPNTGGVSGPTGPGGPPVTHGFSVMPPSAGMFGQAYQRNPSGDLSAKVAQFLPDQAGGIGQTQFGQFVSGNENDNGVTGNDNGNGNGGGGGNGNGTGYGSYSYGNNANYPGGIAFGGVSQGNSKGNWNANNILGPLSSSSNGNTRSAHISPTAKGYNADSGLGPVNSGNTRSAHISPTAQDGNTRSAHISPTAPDEPMPSTDETGNNNINNNTASAAAPGGGGLSKEFEAMFDSASVFDPSHQMKLCANWMNGASSGVAGAGKG